MAKFAKFLAFIGIVILAILIISVGPQKLFYVLANAKLEYLAFSALLIIPIFVLRTLRWQYMLKKQDLNEDFFPLLKIVVVCFFYENITPARTGTFFRAKYLADKSGLPLGKASTTVLIEKLLDFVAVLFFAMCGAYFFISYLENTFIYFLLIAILVIAATLILMDKKLSSFFLQHFYRHLLPDSFKKISKEFFDSFYEKMIKKRQLLVPFAITIAIWLIVYAETFFAAKAVSIELPYIYFVLLVPISTLISLIPITFSGIGTREATLVFLFGMFSIPPEKTVAMSLAGFFATIVLPSVAGFLASFMDFNF